MKEYEDIWGLIYDLEPDVVFESGCKAGINEDGQILISRPRGAHFVFNLEEEPEIQGFLFIAGFEFFLKWEHEPSDGRYWPNLRLI